MAGGRDLPVQFTMSRNIARPAAVIAEDLVANVISIDRLLNDAELTACIESAVMGAPEKGTQDIIDRLMSARQASASMAASLGRRVRPRTA
ncbi:hypothetical protein [Tianweitania sediminis]|uniref:Uncharacterized protein n=2 Tax=Tianweitania sediminis TaxID=1502156 RepID=A0A8J7QYG4_9HYPH|nr:hypothetical protein [Tianweitania sediminis]MBP0437098.1 hypothetical protein [Tianweitania sediminis]